MALASRTEFNEGLITERYYPLLWVFDRLGKHLFAHKWTGNELFARAMEPPEVVQRMRGPLEKEIERHDAKIEELSDQRRKTTDPHRLSTIEIEIQSARNERNATNVKLENIPVVDEGYEKAFDTYQRRSKTEDRLIAALRKGHIQAQCIDGLVLPIELWNGIRGFKYYLTESLAVLPYEYYGKRRGLVVFNKKAFDKWRNGIVPVVIDPASPPTAEALCDARLREQVDSAKGQWIMPKDKHFEEIRDQIYEQAQQRLSRRAFDRSWDRIVPASWKSGGRPPAH